MSNIKKTGILKSINPVNKIDPIKKINPIFTQPENIETIPVYRMLNTQSGTHLFSTDQNEISYVEENLPHFEMENSGNAAFYVLKL